MSKKNISLLATVIAIGITLFLAYSTNKMMAFSTGPFPMDWSISMPDDDTAFGGLFASPEINDSLPHYAYKKTEDSLKMIKAASELDNRSIGAGQTSGSIGVFAIRKTHALSGFDYSKNDPLCIALNDSISLIGNKFTNQNNRDSINKFSEQIRNLNWKSNVRVNELIQENEKKQEMLYYFALNGYMLDDETKFFIQNGTYNLAYVKWDTVIKGSYDSTKSGHYERKQIPVRYAAEANRILIPVTKNQYNVIDNTLTIMFFAISFLFIYLFIGLSIQVLFNISKGDAFNPKNSTRFSTMSLVLFVYALVATLAPYILRLIFRKKIPADFTLQPFSHALITHLYLFLIAVAIFMVGKAFKRGYKLQQEQELTV